MEQQVIIVFIDKMGYQIIITEDDVLRETTYEVLSDPSYLKHFIIDKPISIEDDLGGNEIDIEKRQKLISNEQTVRAIWGDLLSMLDT